MKLTILLLLLSLCFIGCKKEKSFEDDRLIEFRALLVGNTFMLTHVHDGSSVERWNRVPDEVKTDKFIFYTPTIVSVSRENGDVMELEWNAYIENGTLYWLFYNAYYEPITYEVETIMDNQFIVKAPHGNIVLTSIYTKL